MKSVTTGSVHDMGDALKQLAFVTYQGAIPIKDITELEKNVELFKKEYPGVLKAELDAMINAYPDDRRFKEDLRMYQRLFGRK